MFTHVCRRSGFNPGAISTQDSIPLGSVKRGVTSIRWKITKVTAGIARHYPRVQCYVPYRACRLKAIETRDEHLPCNLMDRDGTFNLYNCLYSLCFSCGVCFFGSYLIFNCEVCSCSYIKGLIIAE